MLSRIDEIIYPNRCEVIEIIPSQRYIYPIYKNGRSSLMYAPKYEFKILVNSQIKRAPIIDIFLRDPLERFISGVNTYVYNLKKEQPNLDIDTILYFVEHYLFLNRHYTPQLSWLINLNKFTNSNTKLRFYSMNQLEEVTIYNRPPDEKKILSIDQITRLQNNIHNEMYLRLDNLLLDFIGQETTFSEILKYLQQKDPTAYSKLSCTVLD
jgi:hypothetical protein